MASVEVSNITTTSFKARLIGLQATYAYQRKVSWVIYKLPSGTSVKTAVKYIDAYKGEGGDYTVTGLSPNTEYQACCTVYGLVNGREDYLNSFASDFFYTEAEQGGSGGGSEGGGEEDDDLWTLVDKGSLGTITTPKDISLTIASYKVYRYAFKFAYSGDVIFYTTGNVDTYGQYTDTSVEFDEEAGEVPTKYDIANDKDSGDGNNFRIESEATAGETYWLFVSGQGSGDTGTVTLHIIPPDNPAAETVDKWSWSSSNGSASATQTSNAYNAVTNKKATTNFSHLVWNDMVDKVNEVIKAYSSGKTWDSTYASYANTKMSSTPYYLTAVKFNSLRNNIEIVGNTYLNIGYKTGIGKVETGDYVKGSYFTTLADYINDCIDNL